MDRQMFRMFAVQNESVLEAMKEKARAAAATVKANGLTSAGQRPFGEKRTRKDGTIAGEGEDRDTVVAAWRETGSYFAAARKLNADGIRTVHGGQWYASTVKRIIVRDKATVPLGQRAGVRSLGSRVLSGLLTCHCGRGPMSQTTSRFANKYRCLAGVSNPNHGRYYVSEDALMPLIEAEAAHLRTFSIDEGDGKVQAEIDRLEGKRTRVLENFEDGLYDKAGRDARLAEIDAKLAELGTLAQADSTIATLGPIDFEAPAPMVNEALRALWSEVRLGPDLMPLPDGFKWRRPEWRSEDAPEPITMLDDRRAIRCLICGWEGPGHRLYEPHWSEARKHIKAEHPARWEEGGPLYERVTLYGSG